MAIFILKINLQCHPQWWMFSNISPTVYIVGLSKNVNRRDNSKKLYNYVVCQFNHVVLDHISYITPLNFDCILIR
jgi:hypothetical protein